MPISLNIRDFPLKLKRELKTRAAAKGATLTMYVIKALAMHVAAMEELETRDKDSE